MLCSYEINKGLRIARQLLLDLVRKKKKIDISNELYSRIFFIRMKWVFQLAVNSWTL